MSTTREFHFSDGKSDKFWKITLEGKTHTVQYGRTGAQGQTQTKEFPSESEAQSTHDKLIQEKLRKRRVEPTLEGFELSARAGDDLDRGRIGGAEPEGVCFGDRLLQHGDQPIPAAVKLEGYLGLELGGAGRITRRLRCSIVDLSA